MEVPFVRALGGTVIDHRMFAGERLDDYVIVSELALGGRVRSIKGALSIAMQAANEPPRA